MGDEEAKDTVMADSQQTGDSTAQDKANTGAADVPAATETTSATSATPDASIPKTDGPPAPSIHVKEDDTGKKAPAADENTAATDDDGEDPAKASSAGDAAAAAAKLVPILASSKKSRPPYKYDPTKISLRFIFANRDGLTVTVDCNPSDTVGEVKGALLSVWPEDLPHCNGGEYLRLICMGKGFLMPDTRTLEDCSIPLFKTHPTPINVSVRPNNLGAKGSGGEALSKSGGASGGDPTSNNGANAGAQQTGQGCACTIL